MPRKEKQNHPMKKNDWVSKRPLKKSKARLLEKEEKKKKKEPNGMTKGRVLRPDFIRADCIMGLHTPERSKRSQRSGRPTRILTD